jgi:hypothetical protein
LPKWRRLGKLQHDGLLRFSKVSHHRFFTMALELLNEPRRGRKQTNSGDEWICTTDQDQLFNIYPILSDCNGRIICYNQAIYSNKEGKS